MIKDYKTLQKELHEELINILSYWEKFALDKEHGGFVGRVQNDNTVVPEASKGIILNTRILWSFSAASNYLQSTAYIEICNRAYLYLKNHFKDIKNKGVFWELDFKGNPVNKRKQVYAQAFCIYALSEYYILTNSKEAKDWAIEIFELLENHAHDHNKKGFIEAFDENWYDIEDMRLSDKDMNAAKTMNTHLHVLEAYTTLYKIYPNQKLKESLTELAELFCTTFLNKNNHFNLFYDKNWKLLSNFISFGHDIETVWLVTEAAKALHNDKILKQAKEITIKVADTFLEEGIDIDGAVLNEKNLTTNKIDRDKHWWPQVEAIIGLKYAHNLSKDQKYLKTSYKIWEFTKYNLLDTKNGEWFFRVDKNGKVYIEDDKISMWKSPYHTSRACIKINELNF